MKLARFLQPYRLWVILAPLLMVLEVAMDDMRCGAAAAPDAG